MASRARQSEIKYFASSRLCVSPDQETPRIKETLPTRRDLKLWRRASNQARLN